MREHEDLDAVYGDYRNLKIVKSSGCKQFMKVQGPCAIAMYTDLDAIMELPGNYENGPKPQTSATTELSVEYYRAHFRLCSLVNDYVHFPTRTFPAFNWVSEE